ncbi:MAG: peptidylprolyl isomerase [Flavobacterium sp. BFFFF2]|nr:MAG: peptidylprolyl isomerase [Flavobacterium sp. BFFFF2]
MKLVFKIVTVIALGVSALSFGQQITKKELFTIDGKPFYTDEFARIYKKNLDLVKDESQKDLDQYMQLFVGYKLKVSKALKLKLEEKESYQNELKNYRTQLSKSYLTDSKVTQALVDEAYQRLQKEIRASHVLITLDENASPEDTLKAYKKIVEVREKALKGEDFGSLAQQYSLDPSAKENKGDLGFFSAFRMIYAFESAAYKTPIGQISKPVRTRFGYHVIKVADARENRGEISVAHIMILNKDAEKAAATPEEKAKLDEKASGSSQTPEEIIRDIYKKLQQGEPFEELAKQFSEDKSTAGKGGVLNRFSSGQLSSEVFENVAFSLSKDKPVSEPFQSEYGWHIIKFIDKYPLKSAKEMQVELENKVGKDDRSRLIVNSLNEKLRKKYAIKTDTKLLQQVQAAVTDGIYDATWKVPADTKPYDKKLFAIENEVVTGTSLLQYLDIKQKSAGSTKPKSKWVSNMYENFVDQELNRYYNDHLEQEFPDFGFVMQEYRDGLLLFDLMEKEIWERSKTDTLGLTEFYNRNKANYQWKKRLDVVIYSSTKEDIMQKVHKMVKKNKKNEEIKNAFNTKDKIEVMSNQGTFQEGSDALPKQLEWKEGLSAVIHEGNYYFVVQVNKVLPAGDKTLEESRGKVVNDYQQFLEQNWVSDLKKEFQVQLNQEAFNAVRKELNR